MFKSGLAAQISRIVRRRHLTQADAAKILGITQPKVSFLLNGRNDGFSIDRLFRLLNNLGCDVQIKVSKPRPRSRGRVRVVAA
jgi:predicted XRE-type DNA-binding protein